MDKKIILVTGSEGYIGSILVPALIEQGYRVVGIDTLFFGSSLYSHPQYSLIQKDIRKLTISDVHGVWAIVHLAALSNDPMGELDNELTNEINYEATVNLAKLSRKNGVKRFIYYSSCSVYGQTNNDMVDENSQVHPLTSYAHSKVNSEQGLKKLADTTFQIIAMRNATVYGFSPQFRRDLVINDLVSQAIETGIITLQSDGSAYRPFIDVRDVSLVTWHLLHTKCPPFSIINIGFNDNNYSIKEIAQMVSVVFDSCPIHMPKTAGKDVRNYRVSFDFLTKLIPKYQMKHTVQQSVSDMKGMKERIRKIKQNESIRIRHLQSLLKKNSISKDLYWID